MKIKKALSWMIFFSQQIVSVNLSEIGSNISKQLGVHQPVTDMDFVDITKKLKPDDGSGRAYQVSPEYLIMTIKSLCPSEVVGIKKFC